MAAKEQSDRAANFHRLHSSAIRVTDSDGLADSEIENFTTGRTNFMSWSVSYSGKPADARVAVATQFAAAKESTKHIPHESEGVGLSEAVVNNQLDFLIEHRPEMKVLVAASGSAGIAPEDASWSSYTQTALSVSETV